MLQLMADLRDALSIQGPISGLELVTIIGEEDFVADVDGTDGKYIVRGEHVRLVLAFLEDATTSICR